MADENTSQLNNEDGLLGDNLTQALKDLIGERSISETASAAGIQKSSLSRLLNGKTKPTPETIRKLTVPSANPQGGVTFEQLMLAAGYPITLELPEVHEEVAYNVNKESLEDLLNRLRHLVENNTVEDPAEKRRYNRVRRFLQSYEKYYAGNDDGLVSEPTQGLSTVGMPKENENVRKFSPEESSQDANRTESDRVREHRERYQRIFEQKRRIRVATYGVIQDYADYLVRNAIPLEDHRDEVEVNYHPIEVSCLNNFTCVIQNMNPAIHKINEWRFYTMPIVNDEDNSFVVRRNAREMARMLIWEKPDPLVKVSCIVNSENLFKEILRIAQNGMSYRGEFSLILMDMDRLMPVKEVYLAHYDEGDRSREIYMGRSDNL